MCRHAISNIQNQYTGFTGEGRGASLDAVCVRDTHAYNTPPNSVHVMRFNTRPIVYARFRRRGGEIISRGDRQQRRKTRPLRVCVWNRTVEWSRKREFSFSKTRSRSRGYDKSNGILWISLILDFEINGHVNVYIAYYTMLPFILLLCGREYVWGDRRGRGDDDAFDLLFKRFFFFNSSKERFLKQRGEVKLIKSIEAIFSRWNKKKKV